MMLPKQNSVKSEVKSEPGSLKKNQHPIQRIDLPDETMWGAQIFLPTHYHLGYFQTEEAALMCYDRALKSLSEGTLGQFLEFLGKQRKCGVDVTSIGPPRKKRRYNRQVESKHQKWKRERLEGNKRLAEKIATKRLEILSKRRTISDQSSPKSSTSSPSSTVFRASRPNSLSKLKNQSLLLSR